MQSRMTIKYVTYGKVEKTGLYDILTYLTKPRKNVVFRLDYDKENEHGWDEEDVFIPSIQISKLEFATEKVDNNSSHYATFLCDNKYQKTILKLLWLISQHGDPGHCFGIIFDDNKTGWDGDGSDRIEEINFIKDWKKKEFYGYLDDMPKKVLNYFRAYEVVSKQMMDDGVYDRDTYQKLAEKVAKEYSELQYKKFLEIKDRE